MHIHWWVHIAYPYLYASRYRLIIYASIIAGGKVLTDGEDNMHMSSSTVLIFLVIKLNVKHENYNVVCLFLILVIKRVLNTINYNLTPINNII